MSDLDIYSAECLDCGHVMLFKFSLIGASSFAPLPENIDVSNRCDNCNSDRLKSITFDHAVTKSEKKQNG